MVEQVFRRNAANIFQQVHKADVESLCFTFSEWRSRHPDIEHIVSQVTSGLECSPRVKNILQVSAHLAAEPTSNLFHSNSHSLEVFTLSAVMGFRALQQNRITADELGLMLSAALLHDYKHDGTNNGGIQFRLEDLAFESAKPYLIKAGATDDDLTLIHAIIRTTDVSKDFSNRLAISPSDSVKKYSRTGDVNDLHPELITLHGGNRADIALMVEDADLGGSWLSPGLSHQNGNLLALEQGKNYDPATQIFFIDKICHRQAFSRSGIEILQPRLNYVMSHYSMAHEYPELQGMAQK